MLGTNQDSCKSMILITTAYRRSNCLFARHLLDVLDATPVSQHALTLDTKLHARGVALTGRVP